MKKPHRRRNEAATLLEKTNSRPATTKEKDFSTAQFPNVETTRTLTLQLDWDQDNLSQFLFQVYVR